MRSAGSSIEVLRPLEQAFSPSLSPLVLCATNHSKIARLARCRSSDGVRGSRIRPYLYWNLKHIRSDPGQLTFEFGGHGGNRGLQFSSRVCYGRPVFSWRLGGDLVGEVDLKSGCRTTRCLRSLLRRSDSSARTLRRGRSFWRADPTSRRGGAAGCRNRMGRREGELGGPSC